jgi:RNA ligase
MRYPLRGELLSAVEAGHVSRRTRGDLAIYNYTASCAYGRHWTEVTRAARGLIIEESTGRVVARPFPKFFNVGEMPETAADVLPWDEPHEITEKMDGSLGIVFWYDDMWDIATRGAFGSPQATRARGRMLHRYNLDFILDEENTYLVEIIYPENRIVVDYGDRDELVMIAAIHTETGTEINRATVFEHADDAGMFMTQAVDSHEEDHESNTEGFVVHWPASGLRVKIKSDEYVAAHRIVSLVTPRRVLEAMAGGSDDDLVARLPDHVRGEFIEIRDDLGKSLLSIEMAASIVFNRHRHLLDTDRKSFALAIAGEPPAVKALAFAHASGKDPDAVHMMAIRAVRKTLKAESENPCAACGEVTDFGDSGP